MKINTNNRPQHVQSMLLEQVLTRWWRLVAFRKATNLLHWAMRSVLYRRIATAIKMGSKVGTFFINDLSAVALTAAGAIRSKKLPDGSIKWLPV
jgi:hypothetical protein